MKCPQYLEFDYQMTSRKNGLQVSRYDSYNLEKGFISIPNIFFFFIPDIYLHPCCRLLSVIEVHSMKDIDIVQQTTQTHAHRIENVTDESIVNLDLAQRSYIMDRGRVV